MWIDIACIVFVCVTANHLGLVAAIEQHIGMKMPVVDCSKCLTFWVTLVYLLVETKECNPQVLAISFLASYIAIWLELLEGYIDTFYIMLYEKIYADPDNGTPAADVGEDNTDGTVS